MIFNINYIIYIVYSFLILFVLYISLLLYKKFSYHVFNSEEKIILSEKKTKKKKVSLTSTTNKIKNIKKCFKIKSTEKTYEDIKFISTKPNYINIKNSNTPNEIVNKTIYGDLKKIKDYSNDNSVQKITSIYFDTKQQFYDIFVNTENDEFFIKNLNDFCLFHKNNMNQTNINILLKFYNEDNDLYMYVFVNQNKMIKIIYNDEYNNICDIIEKNNGIFILNDYDIINKYFIGYGNYTKSELNLNDVKNIFFPNTNNYETNKNYKLFSEFKFIKIYFYICNEICLI